MCQATVYLDSEKVMEDVIWVEPTPGGVRLRSLFQESAEVQVQGQLQGIDLLKHRVLLTSKTRGGEEES